MTKDDIKSAVRKAVAALKREVPKLNFGKVHEGSTAHRLAVHLEPFFAGWNVDCEFDRDGEDTKALAGIARCVEERTSDRVRPDIIVHHRQQSGREHNVLVVEIKKRKPENTNDREKLKRFTKPLGSYEYKLGLYVSIDGEKFTLTWYEDGEPSSETPEMH